MGQSFGSGRRNDDHYQQNPSLSYSSPPPPNQSAQIPSASSHPQLPLPPPPSQTPTPSYRTPYQMTLAPGPSASYYQQPSPWTTRPAYPQYYGPSRSDCWWMRPPPPPPLPPRAHYPATFSQPPAPPPPFVEQAKKVKNDVNVHKDSIQMVLDEENLDHHLVCFTFDAIVDGSVTIYYFGKEGIEGDISPLYPDVYKPKAIPFVKGLGQKFVQPSGSGIDLGFFELDELSNPLPGDIFPLVVYAKSCTSNNENVVQSSNNTHAQITQAVIEKNNHGNFQVKVVKQILWIDGERYELQEIFGLVNSAEPEVARENDPDTGKECVICLSEPKNTTVLPCRHMCMCSECAKALRMQSNKCPICRQPVEQLLEIKLKDAEP